MESEEPLGRSDNVIRGYLGIDNGTQGLSVIFTDEDLHVVATGEGTYGFVPHDPDAPEGRFEQRCEDWDNALKTAMNSMRLNFQNKLSNDRFEILAIGISGQMHGEVLIDNDGNPLPAVRLWCDARNEQEGHELTELFGTKIPKRSTAARFLWTSRHQTSKAVAVNHITTPAGWFSYRLTGEFTLGIGDAAGMFPIDQSTHNYDELMLEKFDKLIDDPSIAPLATMLPKVKKAGDDAGLLTESGAALLCISQTGIPVAAAEGDQVAALAGSLIGKAGSISCCFGTSVCANAVGDRAFRGVSQMVDHFCAADGKPINMVWLRNDTTFLNAVVQSYGDMLKVSDDVRQEDAFECIMPLLIDAPPDCGGLLALPFMNDEPGLNVSQGGTALVLGLSEKNLNVGNVAKAALLSTIFNLRLGCDVLAQQGYPQSELVLTGGLTKSPECGQILADAFNVPVKLLASADEGSCWGAAVLAKYRYLVATGYKEDYSTFLDSIATEARQKVFLPDEKTVPIYNNVFERYAKLIKLEPLLNGVVATS